MSEFVVVTLATMTDAALISSTLAEDDHAPWSSGTTYALADRVISTATHRVYESAQAGNTGHDPTTDTGTWWTEIDATNRWRMFDQSTGSASSASGSIEVVMQPGRADTVACIGVLANTVRVQQSIGGSGVYDETQSTSSRVDETLTWSGYFFGDFTARESVRFDGLTADSTATITVTIDGGTGTASVGEIVAGVQSTLGTSKQSARVGIADYSRKVTDPDTGRASLVPRRYAKTMAVAIKVDDDRVDVVAAKLAALRAAPALWVASATNGHEALSVYGWVRDWTIAIQYATFSLLTLDIEGLA